MVVFSRNLPDGIKQAKVGLANRIMAEPPRTTTSINADLSKGDMVKNGNIVGVGIGVKKLNNEETETPCIKVYVVKKLPEARMGLDVLIRPIEGGVPTDIVEIGNVAATICEERFRPVPGGASIGHCRVGRGTLACLVRDNNEVYLLSNNHVFVDCNDRSTEDSILQPGPCDEDASENDIIGQLYSFKPISFEKPNRVDMAICKPVWDWWQCVTPFILQIGEIREDITSYIGMPVKKMGSATELTHGVVSAIDVDVWVNYRVKTTSGDIAYPAARFERQVFVESSVPNERFSAPGDSGALVLGDGNRVCGLLFANSDAGGFSVINQIDEVKTELKTMLSANADLWTFQW